MYTLIWIPSPCLAAFDLVSLFFRKIGGDNPMVWLMFPDAFWTCVYIYIYTYIYAQLYMYTHSDFSTCCDRSYQSWMNVLTKKTYGCTIPFMVEGPHYNMAYRSPRVISLLIPIVLVIVRCKTMWICVDIDRYRLPLHSKWLRLKNW